MAIAVDTVTSSKADSVSSVTLAHTCNGSNRILVVAVVQENGTGTIPAISSVKYNGVTMTLAIAENSYSPSHIRTSLYYLVAPTTGSNNVVVTFASTASKDIIVGAISLTGVDQTSPIDATTTNSNFGTSLTTTITTVADNAYIIDALYSYISASAANGQSQQYTQTATTDGSIGRSYGGATTTHGSQGFGYTWGSASDISQAVVSLKPATAVASSSGFLALL